MHLNFKMYISFSYLYENVKCFTEEIGLYKLDKLNPYIKALALIYRRLVWDINPKSFISRNKLNIWKDKCKGKKAVILCNGPSLMEVDFELLDTSSVFCFGLNKINLLFDKVKFRPDAIACVNKFVIEQNIDFFNSCEIPIFIDSIGSSIGVKTRENMAFIHSLNLKGEFAKDCSMSLCQGNTVTYVALQLAYHFGFTEVALVGCDHSFATKGVANKTVKAEGADPNHFDPNYFTNGTNWQLPDLLGSELSYQKAREVYELNGRKIYNCTDGGLLEVFERKSLKEFLK